MTYTESKNQTPFDWNEFLNKSYITEKEWANAKLLSSDWVTCACGAQCDIIPRESLGWPEDELLYQLGENFNVAISYRNIPRAKDILQKIELRSSELINEINK